MSSSIWPPYQAFYIEALLYSTTAALQSIEIIGNYIEQLESEDKSVFFTQQNILDALQNVITQAGILSRYFWPSKEKKIHVDRGDYLRRVFKIDHDNPLRSRNIRNLIEHFDENLDLHISKGIAGHIVPFYVGLSGESSGVPLHVFRAYYVDLGVFEVLGNRYAIEPLTNEIYRIHIILEQFVQSGHMMREPSS